MKTWTLLDNNRTLISPSDASIQLDQDATTVVDFGEIAVVLLNQPSNTVSPNVAAYNLLGKLLWQMAAPHRQQRNVFTGIAKEDSGTVILSDWVGFIRYVNINTGEIQRSEEVR